MRSLLIMRHGLAKNPDTSEENDFDRPLKEKGKRDAQRMGVYLAQNNLLPQTTWASAAVRTATTAEKCLKAGGLSLQQLVVEDSLYNADSIVLRRALAQTPAAHQTALLVAHNPGVTHLVYTLVGDAMNQTSLSGAMSPGMLIHLVMEAPWHTLQHPTPTPPCRVEAVIDPDTLPRDFPYPDLNSTDRRPRPRYYYTQACAIPYRMQGTGIEILIITSSSGRHWTLPKGIIDPGLSGAEAAAREAWEEAGIRGEVALEPYDSLQVEKWDGLCTVAMHPMSVTTMVADEDWPENQRQRQWVPAHEAVTRLRNPDMAAVVQALVKDTAS